ncbi:MAG: hypothetical protein OEM02_10840 [Desulfobulbaceae bacterium]|nr:hypothetical protein [Desulfobulbaceae bacterium]
MDKIPCNRCSRLILIATACETNGVCMPCFKETTGQKTKEEQVLPQLKMVELEKIFLEKLEDKFVCDLQQMIQIYYSDIEYGMTPPYLQMVILLSVFQTKLYDIGLYQYIKGGDGDFAKDVTMYLRLIKAHEASRLFAISCG